MSIKGTPTTPLHALSGATPPERGYFGPYGGRYVPETLVPALEELERGWDDVREDAGFQTELADLQ